MMEEKVMVLGEEGLFYQQDVAVLKDIRDDKTKIATKKMMELDRQRRFDWRFIFDFEDRVSSYSMFRTNAQDAFSELKRRGYGMAHIRQPVYVAEMRKGNGGY